MINPTNIPDSVFSEIASRVDSLPEGTSNPWGRAAGRWGMDVYRARYFGREMMCWGLLTSGASPDRAEQESGVEPFTIKRQTEVLARRPRG